MKAKKRSATVEIEHDCGATEALDMLLEVAEKLGLHVKQRERDTSVVLTITRGIKPKPKGPSGPPKEPPPEPRSATMAWHFSSPPLFVRGPDGPPPEGTKR